MQPVIAALHLDDAISPCRGSRQSHSVHRAFSPAIAKPHHLYREPFAYLFREFPFHVVWHAEHGASAQLLLYGAHHGGMTVPCHERAETKIEINVFVPIDMVNVATLTIPHK